MEEELEQELGKQAEAEDVDALSDLEPPAEEDLVLRALAAAVREEEVLVRITRQMLFQEMAISRILARTVMSPNESLILALTALKNALSNQMLALADKERVLVDKESLLLGFCIITIRKREAVGETGIRIRGSVGGSEIPTRVRVTLLTEGGQVVGQPKEVLVDENNEWQATFDNRGNAAIVRVEGVDVQCRPAQRLIDRIPDP